MKNDRKKCCTNATGGAITITGETIAIFQNIAISEYRKIVFGSNDLNTATSTIAKLRKRYLISSSRIAETC